MNGTVEPTCDKFNSSHHHHSVSLDIKDDDLCRTELAVTSVNRCSFPHKVVMSPDATLTVSPPLSPYRQIIAGSICSEQTVSTISPDSGDKEKTSASDSSLKRRILNALGATISSYRQSRLSSTEEVKARSKKSNGGILKQEKKRTKSFAMRRQARVIADSEMLLLDNSELNVAPSWKPISSGLKVEIEKSLLDWPADKAIRACCSTQTLPSGLCPSSLWENDQKSSPTRQCRPLSWSCDNPDFSARQGSSIAIKRKSIGDRTHQADRSANLIAESRDELGSSHSHLEFSSEMEDQLHALEYVDWSEQQRIRQFRRMSTPHPIKARTERQPTVKHDVSTRRTHMRSKSEPPRLDRAYGTSVTKKLARIGIAVGDIASLGNLLGSSKNPGATTSGATTLVERSIADALWDHVAGEKEELSFHAGEVILVFDQADKHWWWGRLQGTLLDGWFPATFVRLRANQDVTVDELKQEVKLGKVDTLGVVQHYSSSLLSRDQARRNVINEIITAERDYVKHLHDIVEGHIYHAKQRTDMFSEKQIAVIFGNIEDLYSIAKSFLEQLEKCLVEGAVHTSQVGQCFLDCKDQFEIYSTYCNNHPRSLEMLQSLQQDPKYTHFFEACRLLQNMIELPLDGFLLTPIQKICKYPLQLSELLKYTSEDHSDFTPLRNALGAMKDIAALINERKRKLESIQKLAEWQNSVDDWEEDDLLANSSELLHSGELSKLSNGNRLVERIFFLFDHLLIQCKKELLKRSLVYKSRLSLDDHTIVSLEDGVRVNNGSLLAKNAFEIRDHDGNAVLYLCAKSAEDKEKWLQAFVRERALVQRDQDNGFLATDSIKALALLNSPARMAKPYKPPAYRRMIAESKLEVLNDITKDKIQNNKVKRKGIMQKLKKPKIIASVS